MVVKVAATTCVQWTQPSISHSPSASQTLGSAMTSLSSSSCSRRWNGNDGASLVFRSVQRSPLLGTTSSKLYRSKSCEFPKPRFSSTTTIRRAFSASLDAAFSDEDFSKKIHELALQFQISDDDDNKLSNPFMDTSRHSETIGIFDESGERESSRTEKIESFNGILGSSEPQWCKNEPSDWPVRDDIIPAVIERKANSLDIPLSLRILKRKLKKQQWQEGLFFREAGESAYCSVKKAFSSMVFIIRELHSYTLQMRELLFYEDLQGIWDRVQREMHASFVWLFEQVFSRTPTLMVYVMILLANFTVHSMSMNSGIALEIGNHTGNIESVSPLNVDKGANDGDEREVATTNNQKFDSSVVKSFSVTSSSGGKTASIGGSNGGGGGKVKPVVSGTDGDGMFDRSGNGTILPGDGVSQASVFGQEEIKEEQEEVEEARLWNSIVDEASRMQAEVRDEALDNETVQSFVSPVTANVEEEAAAAAAAAEQTADHAAGVLRTEFVYKTCLAREPDNPLFLANYAQFLYTVLNDYDRAEQYFKRAVEAEPKDAEAFSKYAIFLWRARNDLWAAEETFQEAIATEPDNSFYAANYAHFLWNTGAEDTCFPLSPPDSPLDE